MTKLTNWLTNWLQQRTKGPVHTRALVKIWCMRQTPRISGAFPNMVCLYLYCKFYLVCATFCKHFASHIAMYFWFTPLLCLYPYLYNINLAFSSLVPNWLSTALSIYYYCGGLNENRLLRFEVFDAVKMWITNLSIVLEWNRKTHNYMPKYFKYRQGWKMLACNCGFSCFIQGQYSNFWFTFSLHQKLQISVTCFHLSPHSSNILREPVCELDPWFSAKVSWSA